MNYTDIVLIPKVPNPTSTSQFRPISLCNFLYKVISKVLTNRLKPILSDLITPFQSAFVSGRLIQDNILVAHEAFHHLRIKKRGQKEECAVKLDMNKAYDRVDWGFLFEVLKKLGFCVQWINWIRACVTTVTYRVVINGKKTEPFRPTRGIRQGDPLSPYLFILVADVLSRQVCRAVERKSLEGIRIKKGCPTLHHLFFADDLLFFLKATHTNARVLREVIHNFCNASGQGVNCEKSNIFFSANTSEESKRAVEDVFGIRTVDNPGKYLGLPTLLGRSKKEALAFLRDKVVNRLQGWKCQLLNNAGKEVLLKAVVTAIPTYTMSLFLLPKTWCRERNSLMANFWWGNKNTAFTGKAGTPLQRQSRWEG